VDAAARSPRRQRPYLCSIKCLVSIYSSPIWLVGRNRSTQLRRHNTIRMRKKPQHDGTPPHRGTPPHGGKPPTPRLPLKPGRTEQRVYTPDLGAALDELQDRRLQFQQAHSDGMNALKRGDYLALGDAINRERALLEQQAANIEVRRKPKRSKK
jgi:hypothetical protein